MAILCINTNSPGMTAVTPRFIYIDTNDTVATVTTVGYLNDSVKKFGIQLNEHDLAVVSTRDTPAAKDFNAGIYARWLLDSAGSIDKDRSKALNYLNASGNESAGGSVVYLFPENDGLGEVQILRAEIRL